MNRLFVFLLLCFLLPVSAWAAEEVTPIPEDNVVYHQVTERLNNIAPKNEDQLRVVSDYMESHQVEVQKVADLRDLMAEEVRAIDTEMAKYGSNMSEKNRQALRAAMEFLVRIDQSHLPLTRRPADYLADYQTFTQMLNRVKWYVNMPVVSAPKEYRPLSDDVAYVSIEPKTAAAPVVGGGPIGTYQYGSGPTVIRHETSLLGGIWLFGHRSKAGCPPGEVSCPPGQAPLPPPGG